MDTTNVGAAYHGMGPLDKAFVHYERAIECLGPSAWAQGLDTVELLGAGTRTQEAAANVVAGLAPTSVGLAASPRSHP